MRGLLPALLLLAAVIACSGDDSTATTPSDDPNALARQVTDAWNDVDTFHASWNSSDAEDRIEADFASPDRISLHQTNRAGAKKFTLSAVLTKRGQLSRTCVEDDCSGWAFVPWDFYGGDNFLRFGRDIPLNIIRHILADLREPIILTPDDDGLVHLSAEFNVARATLNSTIANMELFGLDFGNSCEDQFGGSSLGASAAPTSDCHDFTADDMRAANEPAIGHYEDPPQLVDVWVSPETLLPERMRFGLHSEIPVFAGEPGNPYTDSYPQEFDIRFSRYDDITVDVPEIEVQ